MKINRTLSKISLLSAAVALGLALAACPKKSGPTDPQTPARPTPTDPTGPATPTSPDSPPAESPPTSELQAPLFVEVSGPERVTAGDRVEVVVRIRRAAPSALPMEFSVTVPPGANLRDGALTATITDATATLIERRIQLELDRVPLEDLVVTVDQRAPDHGVHATAHYRFGRPEPRLPDPRRSTATPPVNGRPMGRPILLGN